MASKKIVVISDTHHGHMAGLTPPGFQLPIDAKSHIRRKFAIWQRASWDWFAEEIAKIGSVDVLFHLGDWIEGKGERSGGTELLMSDRVEQCNMANTVFDLISPSSARFVFGTKSHTGVEEDWEQVIADGLEVPIGSHSWVSVNGVVFDLKHKIGSSSIPHGRATPLARSRVWNLLQYERDLQPRSDVLIRGHVHYFQAIQDAGGLSITMPALQGWGSKFGSRECEGTVDFGFLEFTCDDGGFEWKRHLMNLKRFAPVAERL